MPPIALERMMTDSFDTIHVIETLKFKCQEDKKLADLISESLRKARITAEQKMDAELYHALNWPADISEYLQYLTDFAQWEPQPNNYTVWMKPGIANHQEVYDRISHFYWLISQNVGFSNNMVVENIPWFKNWLLIYAKLWEHFLNTTDTFCQEVLNSFIFDSPMYKVENAMANGWPRIPKGWLSHNPVFTNEQASHHRSF
jgi:hypothetical protein